MEAEVAVLGELRVTVQGTDVTPTARRERALLAVLAVHRGRAVATDRLAEELWPSLPGARARRVVQVRVGDLRQRFARAGAADLLESSSTGYALHLDPEQLDAERFKALVELASDRSEAGDPAGAATSLRQALDLWRGPPYADIEGSVLVEAEAVRLEELRQGALQEWATAELALGHHRQLLPDLESLVASQPLRERLWELLIVALYRSGRQADALRACTAVRRRLGDELGVEPGAGLRDLETAVLQQQAALDWVPPVARTTSGAGASTTKPSVPEPSVPAPPTTGAAPGPGAHNLPLVEPLIGRDLEVAEVADLVRTRRLVTVTGTGGVGKSHLAIMVAAAVAAEVPGGAWLAELAPVADAAGLVGAVAGALPLPSLVTTAAELAAQIGDRQLLLVLDNCEHLLDAVAPLGAALLRSCPGFRLLCTSQEVLHIAGEHVWPLQPLVSGAAAELFDQRARAVRPGLVLDPGTVATIVDHLDRVPLAIELAAARVATFSPEEIAAHLDDRLRFLRGGPRDAPARHHSLRALVEWSFELLDPGAQRVFRRLAVFAGGFTVDAADQVAGSDAAGADGADDVVDRLHDLVRRSLVVADVTSGDTRYRLLETLRQYATERLEAAGELEALRRRHADWCVGHATRLEGFALSDEERYLRCGQDELDNFGAAVAWAVARGETDLAVRLVAGLWRLHFLWRTELLDWARQVLALPGVDDHPAVGYLHLTVANLTWPSGRIDESERAAREALRHPLDEDAWWSACSAFTDMLFYQSRFAESRAALAAAPDRLRAPHNRVMFRAKILGGEAFGARPTGLDPVQLVNDADDIGTPWVRCLGRLGSAFALVGRGRPDEAAAMVRNGLEIAGSGLNRLAIGILNEAFGLISVTDTDRSGAHDLAERATRALELEREYPVALGYALVGLVLSAERLGHHDDAALLAGYLRANSLRLAVPPRSVEAMMGGPLDRFGTTSTHAFDQGRALTGAELDAELRRLAGHDPAAGHPGPPLPPPGRSPGSADAATR